MRGYEITDLEEEIVKVLLEILRNPRKMAVCGGLISYGDLVRAIKFDINPRNLAAPLGKISTWCSEIGAPLLSVMVINQDKNHPGKGFFDLYGDLYEVHVKKEDEIVVFLSELEKVRRYTEWNRLEEYLGI